jgi:hypothetical protein
LSQPGVVPCVRQPKLCRGRREPTHEGDLKARSLDQSRAESVKAAGHCKDLFRGELCPQPSGWRLPCRRAGTPISRVRTGRQCANAHPSGAASATRFMCDPARANLLTSMPVDCGQTVQHGTKRPAWSNPERRHSSAAKHGATRLSWWQIRMQQQQEGLALAISPLR